jgi:hypothetical protein
MSIAEFYIENGIDPGDPDHLDRFLATYGDFSDDDEGGGQERWEPWDARTGTADELDRILQRHVDTRAGPFTQFDIPAEIDEVDACTADYAARAIQVMKLTEYNVMGMPVSPGGLRLLAECLHTNSPLQKLQLESEECYQIGEAYKALGDALRVNTTLTELRIVHHPQATPAQEKDLIDAIAMNETLKVVILDELSEEGERALAGAMRNR